MLQDLFSWAGKYLNWKLIVQAYGNWFDLNTQLNLTQMLESSIFKEGGGGGFFF